jgi:hypothetical protein
MLVLVDLGPILVSTSLLNNELHGLYSLSHTSVQLYLDCVNVEMDVLAESYQLRQGLLNTLLQVSLRHLEGDAAVRCPALHAVWE